MGFEDISIITSGWNDETTYYKQIEAMITYGNPQGYFGFNESYSIYGNFAAWSPILLMPYVIIGKLFTWNYYTSIIFHLFIWVAAFLLLTISLRPDYKQLLSVAAVWLSFEVGLRYIFSVTPESLITVLVFCFFICLIKLNEDIKIPWLIFADVCFVLLTLMRGYYAALGLLICHIVWVKAKSKKMLFIQIAIVMASAIGYALILHFLTAAYYETLVDTEWMTHPKAFVKVILLSILEMLVYIKDTIIRTPSHEAIRGAWYIIYCLLGGWLIYAYKRHKDLIYISSLVCWCAFIGAMWLLYNAKEGSRQLMALGIIGIMFSVYFSANKLWTLVVAVILIYSTWFSNDTFFTTMPQKTEFDAATVEKIKSEMSEVMELTDSTWDNTIIKSASLDYRFDYTFPKGFGLNSCYDEYIMEHIDELKGKYIATTSIEDIDAFIEAQGFELIYSYGGNNVYRIR